MSCFTLDAGFLFDGGVCKPGTNTCTNGVFAGCMNQVGPMAEQCNGLDDNCNGQVDDGIPARSCYSGLPATTAGVGICKAGSQTCSSGVFGTCVGEVDPAPSEICGNMLDDNCNGQTDEAPCAAGTYVCTGCSTASDLNQGTQNSPVKTIAKGIANALALKTGTVFVAGTVDGTVGSYSEDLTIPDKVVVQGRWVINTSMGGMVNNWSRTAVARTLLVNTSAAGLKFAAGASRASGIDGMSVQAVATAGAARVIAISVTGASPLLHDFATVGANSSSPPQEAIGVNITGSLAAPANPRLDGVSTVSRSAVVAGDASTSSAGVKSTGGKVELQFVNVQSGGAGTGVSGAVELFDSPSSTVASGTFTAGRATTCIGFFAQGNSGGVTLDTVNATGCPQVPAGLTASVFGGGIVFDNCPTLSGLAGPSVKNSTGVGGVVNGVGSVAVGGGALDGCNPLFQTNSFTGGQASGANAPENAVGMLCSYAGVKNSNGSDSPCRLTNNTLNSGFANATNASGLVCNGTCGTKTSSCFGSCNEVFQNTINASAGKTMAHVAITDSSPFLFANRIGLGANGSASSCATSTVIGVSLDGSGATLVNNFIVGGPCLIAVGVSQLNDVRTGDGSVASPLVHYNTVVASGSGISPTGASSVAVQLTSTAAVAAGVTGKGIYRNNILTAGAVSGAGSLELVVREADAKSDPATFWNNILYSVTGGANPPLYFNEGTTLLTTAPAINALVDMSVQGNLAVNPLFIGAAFGDYHITALSPARGAANATGAPTTDFDADPRPNPVGSTPDIGCDEVP